MFTIVFSIYVMKRNLKNINSLNKLYEIIKTSH